MKGFIFCFVLAVAIASTTTQEPAKTTPAPTPLPTPGTGNWTLTTGTGKNEKLCIMVQMGLRFTANYTDDKNNKTSYTWNFPNNTDAATGFCSTNKSSLVIDGKIDGVVTLNFTLTNEKVQVTKITLQHSGLPGSNKTWVFDADNQSLFTANQGNSYLCKTDQTVKMNGTVNGTMAAVDTFNLQVQAFFKADQKPGMFGTSQECPADAQTSNIVPIAVGAALAALVVIVLIAYLISRNRNKRGYESV